MFCWLLFFGGLWRNETGANALECALVLTLVAMAIVAGATVLGAKLNTLFTNIGNAVASVNVPTL